MLVRTNIETSLLTDDMYAPYCDRGVPAVQIPNGLLNGLTPILNYQPEGWILDDVLGGWVPGDE